MKVAFRADAALHIGTGHVMRCLTLAERLKARGAQCLFVCREHPGNLIDEIRRRGFLVHSMAVCGEFSVSPTEGSSHEFAEWLGADWAADAVQTKSVLHGQAVDWLVVDHYAIDARWEREIRALCKKIMVIDDLANRPHDCDLLLDQNFGREETDYSLLVPSHCTVLVGPLYALLREEFSALRDYSLHRRADPKLKHLLVSMGGVDLTDATGLILDQLRNCSFLTDTRITVVMGPHAPWLEHVNALADQMPQITEVKVNVRNMAQLMADSDLAIGAAGSTSWERCSLGLPTLLVVLAANQRAGASALAQRGGAILLGALDAVPQNLKPALKLLTEPGELRALSLVSRSITNGEGAGAVASRLT